MTSGPMRAGALPPDRQPDPQVIAWMRGHLREYPDTTKVRLISAWLNAHGHDSFTASGHTLPELTAAAKTACSPQPLTAADIPAGQGPASLYLRRLRAGKLVAWYRASDVETIAFGCEPEPHAGPAEHALWDHLLATLPTVDTTEETPVTETPTPTRPGFTAEHLDFARRLIDTAARVGVTIRYCCWNGDWAIMTAPDLDDAAGAAFLASLDIGAVGEPQQIEPNANRSLFAGAPFEDGVRLWVAPTPTDTAEEST